MAVTAKLQPPRYRSPAPHARAHVLGFVEPRLSNRLSNNPCIRKHYSPKWTEDFGKALGIIPKVDKRAARGSSVTFLPRLRGNELGAVIGETHGEVP